MVVIVLAAGALYVFVQRRTSRVAAMTKRNRTFRYVTLGVLALYVVIPMYAAIQFSLEGGYHGRLSFDAYTQAVSQPGLGPSIITSLEVSLGAMVLTLALLVPTIIYAHLRLPRLRPVLEALSLLPLGVPAVVIVVGVLGVYDSLPSWIIGSPLILALFYVIIALPYSYRAIDAGVRSMDLHTLVEAGRSMGAGWMKLFWRVLFPNLRSGILAAAFLTVALSLGEFAIASLDSARHADVPGVASRGRDDEPVYHGRALGRRADRHLGVFSRRSPSSAQGAGAAPPGSSAASSVAPPRKVHRFRRRRSSAEVVA